MSFDPCYFQGQQGAFLPSEQAWAFKALLDVKIMITDRDPQETSQLDYAIYKNSFYFTLFLLMAVFAMSNPRSHCVVG